MNGRIAAASLADYAAVINDEHRAAFGCARDAIEHARVAGEHLIKAKAALKHGEWLPWLKANIEVSEPQAQRYMRVAQNWSALESKSVTVTDLTLRGALDALAKPKPKADPAPVDPPIKAGPKIAADDEPGEVVTAQVAEPKVAKTIPPAQVEKIQAELEEARDMLAEMASAQQPLQDEVEFLRKIESEGDKLAAALAEVRRLQELVRVLEERNRGLMNEKNEAVRAAKSWQRKYDAQCRSAA